MPARNPVRTPRRRRIFLETLRETAMVAEACRRAGAARGSFYNWRYADPEFAAEWDRALDEGMATLEDEAVRRARDGVEVPVFYGGKQVATTRRYSDRLLIFLLRAHRPGRYCERARAAAYGGYGVRDGNSPGAWSRLPTPVPPGTEPDIRAARHGARHPPARRAPAARAQRRRARRGLPEIHGRAAPAAAAAVRLGGPPSPSLRAQRSNPESRGTASSGLPRRPPASSQ